MKKLLILFSSLFLISYSGLSISASETTPFDDGVFSISDIFYSINVGFGLIWMMWKSVFLFVLYLPSYLFVGSLISTSFGAFMELPAYGYSAMLYISLVYWIGGFFLSEMLDGRGDVPDFSLSVLFYSPFIIGFLGLLFGWFGDVELALKLMRMEYLSCLVGGTDNESFQCLALF